MTSTSTRLPVVSVLVLGESGVGKSTYTRHIEHNAGFSPTERLPSTIDPVDYKTIPYEVTTTGDLVTLLMLDCAGAQQAVSAMPNTARHANIVFLVYDVTRRESFVDVRERWAPHALTNCRDDPIKVLIGNKVDKLLHRPGKRRIQQEEAREFGKSIGAAHCYEMSALETTDEALALLRCPLDIALTEHLERLRTQTPAQSDTRPPIRNPLMLADDDRAASAQKTAGDCCT